MSRFLIIDDNVSFAENLAEIIGDLGDEAVVADCGTRALELVRQQRFDVVVSDMRMPEMSGIEVVRRIRQIDAGLPVVLVTAYSAEQDDLAQHAGLLAVLPKPVPIARLLEILSRARRNAVVAIIDDDAALVDNWCEILRHHGFAPVSASSLAELDALADLPFLAALVDLRLPGGPDGEAMRRLAARFPGLPQLAMSGHAEIELPVRAQARFTKPVSLALLVEHLERLRATQPTS